jgi:hypothetical protein
MGPALLMERYGDNEKESSALQKCLGIGICSHSGNGGPKVMSNGTLIKSNGHKVMAGSGIRG